MNVPPAASTTLVFLPGLACDARMWQGIAQPSVAPPGWSVQVAMSHTRAHSVEAMATALLDGLGADGSGQLVLCGASMGGIIAMEAIRQAPDRVVGLALLGTNARPETPDMRQLREGAMQLFAAGRAEEVLRFNVPLAFHPSNADQHALTGAYLKMVLDAGADALIAQNRAIIHRPDARLHLPQVNCKTLVLCGESDQLTPPECSREIASLIPGAQFQVVAQAGHMLTMEQPALVQALLRQFLAQ